MTQPRIHLHDLHPDLDDFSADVQKGLAQRPASIPPKYFYDEQGSRLFEAITELPEYYPTRTEISILKKYAADIAAQIGTGSLLVEPGGGACAKVHILLQGLQPVAYVPMDISKDHLWAAAQQLAAQFPWLEVHAACADFTRPLLLPESVPKGFRVAFFPGSSIGNFDPEGAVEFLKLIRGLVGDGGYLLIGVDLKKDKAVLEAAYDDAAGITAEFNLNLLARINQELGADFNLVHWQHKALYDETLGRIEMHLISTQDQVIHLDGKDYVFKTGESIHTENSYKYDIEDFQKLAAKAGFCSKSVWTDDTDLFSVHLYFAE